MAQNVQLQNVQVINNGERQQEVAMSANVCSMNIHSLTNKRPELELYLRESEIDIVAIQETRREADS